MRTEEQKKDNAAYMRKRNATPEGKAYNKMAYQRDKERKESQRLQRKYGINSHDYDSMYTAQQGSCAICKGHQSELKHSLVVDHCHTTLRVRGLLCGSCNRALGLLKDNITNLQEAINYLKENT